MSDKLRHLADQHAHAHTAPGQSLMVQAVIVLGAELERELARSAPGVLTAYQWADRLRRWT